MFKILPLVSLVMRCRCGNVNVNGNIMQDMEISLLLKLSARRYTILSKQDQIIAIADMMLLQSKCAWAFLLLSCRR